MIEYYKKRVVELEQQQIAYANMGNDAKVKQLEKDIRNFKTRITELEGGQ